MRSKNPSQNRALQRLKRQSIGAISFAKIKLVTVRVDRPGKNGAGWLMEVAWPGGVRRRWIARVGHRRTEPLPLYAAKQAAIAFLRQRRVTESLRTHHDHIAILNLVAAYEVDHAALQQERRRWPIDLMNGTRRGFVEQRAAIIEAELTTPTEEAPALQASDYSLEYYADGYPKLPEFLRRTLEEVRFSDAA